MDWRARAREIAIEEKVNPDLFLKLVGTESNFNPTARSPKGAMGLGQLMPGTAADLGVNPADPEQNLRGSARYLRQMHEKFQSTPLAVAAYNAGPGRVQRAGGIPRIPETEAYVKKVAGDPSLQSGADIFELDAPQVAAARPSQGAQPSIRRGADGTIEIDINEGRGGDQSIGADIFEDAPPASATDMASAVPKPKPAPYNKGVWGETVDAFNTATGAIGKAMSEGEAARADSRKRPIAERLARFLPDVAGDVGRELSIAGNAAGAVMAPITGVTRSLVTKPAAEGLTRIMPQGYDRQSLAEVVNGLVTGKATAPRKMTPEQTRDKLEGEIGIAISTGMPAKMGPPSLPKLPPKTAQRVAAALERAAAGDDTNLAAIAAKARATPEVPAFQSGGENMTGLAEVIAQSPGRGATRVTKAVRNDQAAASRRIKDAIGQGLGGEGNFLETLDAKVAERALKAREGIAPIEQAEVKLQPNAIEALRSDLAKGAIKESAQNMLADPDDAVRAAGAELNRLADTLLDNPAAAKITVRGAQDISRALMDAADDAYKSGSGSRGKALKGLGRAIRDNAADPARGGVGEYGDWLKQYGADSDHVDALNLGRDVLSGKREMSAEALRKSVKDMDETSQAYFRKGVGEAVLNEARTKGSVNAMRRTLKEEIGDRVRVAFPDDTSFQRFMDAAETEVIREARNNRVVNNSRTFGRQAAADDLKAQAGMDPMDIVSGAVDAAADIPSIPGKALKAALKTLPKKDRSIFGDPEMNDLLGKALTDPDEMTKLLNVLEVLKARRTAPLSLRLADASRKAAPLLLTDQAVAGERN